MSTIFAIIDSRVKNFHFPIESHIHLTTYTVLGKGVVPRLRELAPRDQMESGGGIHAT